VLGLRAAGVLLRCGTNAQMLMAANATHSTAVPKCDVLNLMFCTARRAPRLPCAGR
jgi:hypothetical protein